MQAPAARVRNDTQARGLALLRKAVDQHGYEDAAKIVYGRVPPNLQGKPFRAAVKQAEVQMSQGTFADFEGAIERLEAAAY